MEFVQAAAPLGLRAIHGAEVDLEDGRHLTLLVESERGWRNLCHLLTRAHAHTRGAVDETVEDRAARRSGIGRRESLVGTRMRRVDVPPELSLAAIEEHAEGLVCLSGCALQRGARRADAAAAAGGVRRRSPAGRAAAAVPARRPRAQPRAGRSGRPAGRGDGGHRQRPRARARARAAAGRVHGAAPSHDAGRVGADAARQLLARAGLAGGDGGALPRAPGGGGGDARAGRPPAVRPERRPRVPLPGVRRRAGAQQARRAVLGRSWGSATRPATRTRPPRTRGSRRSCG